MSPEPDGVELLRKKLYEKAKQEPDFRFYSLYDKVCWGETLHRAYRLGKANAGAAGVEGVRFADIESRAVDRWLAPTPSFGRNWWQRPIARNRWGG